MPHILGGGRGFVKRGLPPHFQRISQWCATARLVAAELLRGRDSRRRPIPARREGRPLWTHPTVQALAGEAALWYRAAGAARFLLVLHHVDANADERIGPTKGIEILQGREVRNVHQTLCFHYLHNDGRRGLGSRCATSADDPAVNDAAAYDAPDE